MLARKLQVSVEYLETGSELREVDERELRLANAELELRIGTEPAAAERAFRQVLREAIDAGDAASATRARIGLGLSTADARPSEAIEFLAEVVEDGGVPVSTRPDVYATLGQAYSRAGEPRRARPRGAGMRAGRAALDDFSVRDAIEERLLALVAPPPVR